MDKHCRLLETLVNYFRKKFYNVGPGQTNKAEKHNDNEATKPDQRYKAFLFVTDVGDK
jgi:hypothetical protein